MHLCILYAGHIMSGGTSPWVIFFKYRSFAIFSSHNSRKTPHIWPVRARNGVLFVSANLTEVPLQWRHNVAIASKIISLTIVYSTDYSDADQTKHQSSTSLAFVRGIHPGPVNSPHKWPVTRKMFPFDDVIMVPYIAATYRESTVQPFLLL